MVLDKPKEIQALELLLKRVTGTEKAQIISQLSRHYTAAEPVPLLRAAAMNYMLDQVPKEVLTRENLLSVYAGDTVIFIAAGAGELHQIPQEVLTIELLSAPNSKKITSYHEAASCGHLHQIPSALITAETMTLQDRDGYTPAYWAIRKGQAYLLPTDVLNENVLLAPTWNNDNALQWAVSEGNLDQLIGVPLSEQCRDIVGVEWFEKNQKYLLKQQLLKEQLLENAETNELELF